ncbi:hypothetical protein [Blastococcus sp. SYSU D00695]
MALTLSAAAPDGSAVTVTSLLAVAVDEHRMLFLQQVAQDGAPADEAGFRDLFTWAFEAQQDS